MSKKLNKAIASITSLALGCTFVAGMDLSSADKTVSAVTVQSIVNEMGNGWNLGNSFDSTNTWDTNYSPTTLETMWGNPVTTKSMIDAIAFYGFKTIRVPVTWYQMTDASGNINTEYLARIKEVVDYCYANDLYVIINMHHDGLSGNWLYQGVGAKDQFTSMWSQIAQYFADYDSHLVFEGWNEIDWDYSTINTMAQAFVDTVRATGGNNAERLLVIPGKNTDVENTLKDEFVMPSDPANMLAVDVHYYYPTNFTVNYEGSGWGTPASTWGTDAELAAVKNDMAKLESKFVENGYGVIVGEYGVINEGKEEDSRVIFTKTVASYADEIDGICPILWDSSNCGDMKYFDRLSQSWYNSEIGEFYKQLNGGNYTNQDGLILTDRITLKGTMDESDLMVDISALKDKAKIKDVIWKVDTENVTSLGYYGLVAVQGNINYTGSAETSWAYIPVSIEQTNDYYTTALNADWFNEDIAGADTPVDGAALDYDYLKFSIWYLGSKASTPPTVTFNTDVTVVFEEPIWVTPDYTIPGDDEPEVTTTPAEVTTTTEDITTTTEDVTTTTDDVTTTSAPDVTTTTGGDEVNYDVNGDGKVTSVDLVVLKQVLLEMKSSDDFPNADVDGNGKIAAKDLILVKNYLLS